jgi:hypothetical protein
MYKQYNVRYSSLIFLLALLFISSCNKYLDKKPSNSLAVPSSLQDLQEVLDDQRANTFSPAFLELVADNYYITSGSLSTIGVDERMNYLWDKDARILVSNAVWNNPYTAVYEANFVLDNLAKISIAASEQDQANSVKGTALFYRSFMFYQLAQLFCKPYSSTAATDPGIVLRTTADVSASIVRSSVQETYDRIVGDLQNAAQLLPATSAYATRPNKAAAYGALARVCLTMRDYTRAMLYADSSLILNSTLLDYNTLKPAGSPVLPDTYLNNPEVLFVSRQSSAVFNASQIALVDSTLYQSYNANDLRKTVFFEPNGTSGYWKGSYFSYGLNYTIFDGVATDEVYLVRAEARARNGNKDLAMTDLNTLLRNRWKTGTFTDLTAATAADALNLILNERRKELLFRGLRWSDLRRFNLEGANITLKRVFNGNVYSLPPNDPRWVVQIPDQEVTRSGISQNPR